MSLNRTLVAGAGAVVAALGTQQAQKFFAGKSPECLQAIRDQAGDITIRFFCGYHFGSPQLVGMIVVGGGALAVIYFWKDILQFIGEKVSDKS